MTPATVLSFEQGRLKREVRQAGETGDPALVFSAVESALDSVPSRSLLDAASEAFYFVVWLAVEDEALADQAGALDRRISEAVA
jgi:hypothetical protein